MINYFNNKAITLIALIITIIVLLILAGVSLTILGGENGILTKALVAKKETENSQDSENKKLDNYSNFIDDIINGTSRGSSSNSTILDTLQISAIQNTGNIDVTISPIFISGKDSSEIFEYIILANNRVSGSTKNQNYQINSIASSTVYNIKVIAIDMNGDFKISNEVNITSQEKVFTWQLASYPVITGTGIYNLELKDQYGIIYDRKFDAAAGECTAPNAAPLKLYDNATTSILNYNGAYYFAVDSSALNKTITAKFDRGTSSDTTYIQGTNNTFGLLQTFVTDSSHSGVHTHTFTITDNNIKYIKISWYFCTFYDLIVTP
ncbi:hypothetical protein D3C72_953700 [compost metagenome]